MHMANTNTFISGFFKDLNVVELASVLAGPSAGMFFAELGAQLIKVENKKNGGDVTRNWRIPGETKEGPSAYFSSINYKKEHVFLDLTDENDLQQCHYLLTDADIILTNYSEIIAQKLSVDLKTVRELNPQCVFVQLNGFFDSNRPAYDVVLQAETGWISMTGTEGHPAKLPVALIDILSGHQIKEAALLGIIHKLRTGKGSYFEVNLEQVSLSSLANQATNYLMNNEVAGPIGTRHPNIAPYGDWFETQDKIRFVLAIGSEKQFTVFANIIGLDIETSFMTNTDRLKSRDLLVEKISEKVRKWDFKDLAKCMDTEKIPYGKIKSLDEVLHSTPAADLLRIEMMEGRETKRLSGNGFTGRSF